MYFAFSIAINDRASEEIRSAAISVMKDLEFYPAGTNRTVQALQTPGNDLLPEVDDQLMLRKFLISPNINKWCMVYPSTGWFSEVQDFGVELSKRLDCIAMVLLVDDSYGWGYELSQRGQIIDRFHTEPATSPTLREKSEYELLQASEAINRNKVESEKHSTDILTLARLIVPTQEEMTASKKYLLEKHLDNDLLTPEQKTELERKFNAILASLPTLEQRAKLLEQYPRDPSIFASLPLLTQEQIAEAKKYVGNPSIVANLFGVAENEVIHYLPRSQGRSEVWSHDQMIDFFRLLDIEDGDGSYQDFLTELDDKWHHLIFARQMTAVEWQWREKQKARFPFVAPPLWLTE